MARPASTTVALPRTILDQTLSGNMSGLKDLITTQRALQARMAVVLPDLRRAVGLPLVP